RTFFTVRAPHESVTVPNCLWPHRQKQMWRTPYVYTRLNHSSQAVTAAAAGRSFRFGVWARHMIPSMSAGQGGKHFLRPEWSNVVFLGRCFGRRHNETAHMLSEPASKQRQGTKSREMGERHGSSSFSAEQRWTAHVDGWEPTNLQTPS